jgi:hypothetical protein
MQTDFASQNRFAYPLLATRFFCRRCLRHILIWKGAMQRDYSDLLRDYNRLDEARSMIDSAIPLLEKRHLISAFGYGYFSAARNLMASCDFPAAHAMLNKVNDLRRKYILYPDLLTLMQVTRAKMTSAVGTGYRFACLWRLHTALCVRGKKNRYLPGS